MADEMGVSAELGHKTLPTDDVWWHVLVGGGGKGTPATCPYGVPGDRLWVQEAYAFPWLGGADVLCRYLADDTQRTVILTPEDCAKVMARKSDRHKVQPGRFMYRSCSRIFLEVSEVSVERLQDITGYDASCEGCEADWEAFNDATCGKEGWDEPEEFVEECEQECDWVNFGHDLVYSNEHREWELDREQYALRLAFKQLWGSINGPESWDLNPWVWAISFKRLEPA
jgi:hypothetical protein